MFKTHVVESGLMLVWLYEFVIIALMWMAGLSPANVTMAVAMMVSLGVATGLLIPGIIISWLIIGLTSVGTGILLFGYVVMNTHMKLFLLAVFPVVASLTLVVRYILGGLGWLDANRASIEAYASHYDNVVKLQTRHNAEKIYDKSCTFLRTRPDIDMVITVTGIQWVDQQQFKQFNIEDYQLLLQRMATVLKKDRLPEESIYYLGDGLFIILSYELSKSVYQQLNTVTGQELAVLQASGYQPQFKWGHVHIDRHNVSQYLTFEHVLRQIKRAMETDIIVEYMKEGSVD